MSEAAMMFDSFSIPVSDVIDSWCGHVNRFIDELDEHWEDPSLDLWGIDDLGAAYFIRDSIDRTIELRGTRPPHALELADRCLRLITEQTSDEWTKYIGDLAGPGWWWKQIPIRGPVKEQLLGLGWRPPNR